MAKLKNKVDAAALQADIEALKNATTTEEVKAIMAKYSDAVDEMKEKKAVEERRNAKGPVKVVIPPKGTKKPAAKKEEAPKKAPAKKTTTKKAEEAPKKAPVKETTPVVEEPKKTVAKEEEPKKTPAKKTAAKKEDAPKKAPAKKATPKAEAPAEEPKGRSYNGKYEVFQDADGFRYRLKASNGEILVVSEAYTTREGVIKAIDAVQRNVETGKITVFADKRGMFQFKLTSKNYRVLAISANYSTEKGATRASESFAKFAVKADIVDIELDDKEAATATPIEITAEEKAGGKIAVESFNGEFSWELRASNGQVLCRNQGYTSKKGCMDSIEKFKKNVEEGSFKCFKDKNDRFFFKLYNANGRVSIVGESYPSKDSAESAANSVVAFYKTAEIVEVKDED